MTAFNDILTTEDEALKSIEVATTDTATAVAEARVAGEAHIESETKKLEEEEKKALLAQESTISGLTEKIQVEVASNVSAIEQRFETHSADLREELKKHFV
jgi:vacuolar-type H+-ATPase subunit H